MVYTTIIYIGLATRDPVMHLVLEIRFVIIKIFTLSCNDFNTSCQTYIISKWCPLKNTIVTIFLVSIGENNVLCRYLLFPIKIHNLYFIHIF